MEHLSTLDAGFLEAEDSDPHVSLAIGGLAVIEGPIPDHESLMSALAQRVTAVPRFTQVLRTHLLDLEPPEWVEDANIDLSHHLRRAALPQPGDDRELFRFVADVMERRLDRDHPLWECWVIENLADDRWAILTKIHHCIADGIASTQLLAGLADGYSSDTFASEIRAAKDDGHKGFRRLNLTLNPLSWISSAWHTSRDMTTATARLIDGAIELTGDLLRPAATSSLIGPVTAMRRYSATQVSLDDVAKVCRTFDVTVNDVALAAITDTFRAALIRRGEEPRRNSLRTLVPVSVRSNEVMGKIDNRVSLMLPYLPVEKADAAEQLRAVHRRLTRAKASGQRQAGTVFVAAANRIPFALSAWTFRMLTRMPQRGVVTVATNVPGPRRRSRLMGRDVLRMMPIPPIALDLRTGIAIFSYADDLVFGITADYDTTPDVDELARGIQRGVARLVELAERGRR